MNPLLTEFHAGKSQGDKNWVIVLLPAVTRSDTCIININLRNCLWLVQILGILFVRTFFYYEELDHLLVGNNRRAAYIASISLFSIRSLSLYPLVFFSFFCNIIQFKKTQKNVMHRSWKNVFFIQGISVWLQGTSVWLVLMSLNSPDNQSTQLASSCSRVLPRFAFWNCTHSTFQSLRPLTLLPPSI